MKIVSVIMDKYEYMMIEREKIFPLICKLVTEYNKSNSKFVVIEQDENAEFFLFNLSKEAKDYVKDN